VPSSQHKEVPNDVRVDGNCIASEPRGLGRVNTGLMGVGLVPQYLEMVWQFIVELFVVGVGHTISSQYFRKEIGVVWRA